MKVTVLGSGTSKGIPIIGCRCRTCLSQNPKDKRLRVSVFLEIRESSKKLDLLIDTSPDFRQQMLVNNITNIDAVLYTHHHFDHIMGLDDISQINYLRKKAVDIYANEATMQAIQRSFSYIWDKNTFRGGGIPSLKTNIITLDKFDIEGVEITPIEYYHGPTPVWGFRIGNFAYLTDCSFIPEEGYSKLRGLEVLIIDALRYTPHVTHFNFEQAIEASQKTGAKQTYFTHMTHDILHDEDDSKLPHGINLAYDGLTIEIAI
jgi:phosphoribosyl 1,2-cyclic phosphate phosphodiesterase